MSRKKLRLFLSVAQFLFFTSIALAAAPKDGVTANDERVPQEVLDRISKFYLMSPLTPEQIEKLPPEARERLRLRQATNKQPEDVTYLSKSGVKFTFSENKLTLDGGGYDKLELKRNYLAPRAGIFDKAGSSIVVTADASLLSGLFNAGNVAIYDGSILQSMSVARFSESTLLNLNLVGTDHLGKKETGFRLVEGGIERTFSDSPRSTFYAFHHQASQHWLYGAPANVYKNPGNNYQIYVPVSLIEAKTSKGYITVSNGSDINWFYDVNVCDSLLHRRHE